MNQIDITGKTALVTGANRGIGKAIVDSLFANGIGKVYAAVRNVASADALVAEYGDKVVPVEFDLGNDDLIRAAASAASDVDIVINNAGVLQPADALTDEGFEALDFELNMNVYGLLRTARAFAPVLKSNGGGAFVQLNSVVSMKCFPDFMTYCASKAAAYSITQGLKDLLGAQGTAVFSVHPGPIATDMADNAGLTEMAEPASLVGDAIIEGFRTGTFHVFPDSMARMIGDAYAGFAENVVEAEMSEA